MNGIAGPSQNDTAYYPETIALVQNSQLGVKRTLEELDVPRSSFYRWYRRYKQEGYDGLANRPPTPGVSGTKYPLVRSSG